MARILTSYPINNNLWLFKISMTLSNQADSRVGLYAIFKKKPVNIHIRDNYETGFILKR